GRHLPWNPVLLTLASHVFLDILTLLLLEHKRRSGPAEGLKNRSEQKGLPAHLDCVLGREIFDTHGAQVAVGTAELEPELDLARLVAAPPRGHSLSLSTRRL